MTSQRELILLVAGDLVLARVVLGDEAGAQVDVRILVDQRRIRPDLVAAHRHQAHRLGAAGDDDVREAAHDVLGGRGNRLQARRAEAVHGDGRRVDRNAGAQARDARDVQPLLGLRHRASEDHVVDVRGLEGRHTTQRLADHGRRHLVRANGSQRAVRRLADRRARRRNDYCVPHVKSASKFLERVADLAGLPVEQVIGAVDLDELLRLLELRVELTHRLQRNQFVAFAVHDELRLRRQLHRRVLVTIHRRRDADQRADPIVVRTCASLQCTSRRRTPQPTAPDQDTSPTGSPPRPGNRPFHRDRCPMSRRCGRRRGS